MKFWRHRLTVLRKKQRESAIILYIVVSEASPIVKNFASKESRGFVLPTV